MITSILIRSDWFGTLESGSAIIGFGQFFKNSKVIIVLDLKQRIDQ